jgi:hypothetical protein
MNRGLCPGSYATVVATSGRSLMSGPTLSYAPRAEQSPFKRFKLATVNVFPGRAGSLEIGLHRLTTTANRYSLGSAYAVTLTA